MQENPNVEYLFCQDTFMIQWETIRIDQKISYHLPNHGSLILISLLSLNHVAFGVYKNYMPVNFRELILPQCICKR